MLLSLPLHTWGTPQDTRQDGTQRCALLTPNLPLPAASGDMLLPHPPSLSLTHTQCTYVSLPMPPRPPGSLQALAVYVAARLGGPAPDAHALAARYAAHAGELKAGRRCVVLGMGCLRVGLPRHRALLFKALGDALGLPSGLAKGSAAGAAAAAAASGAGCSSAVPAADALDDAEAGPALLTVELSGVEHALDVTVAPGTLTPLVPGLPLPPPPPGGLCCVLCWWLLPLQPLLPSSSPSKTPHTHTPVHDYA